MRSAVCLRHDLVLTVRIVVRRYLYIKIATVYAQLVLSLYKNRLVYEINIHGDDNIVFLSRYLTWSVVEYITDTNDRNYFIRIETYTCIIHSKRRPNINDNID